MDLLYTVICLVGAVVFLLGFVSFATQASDLFVHNTPFRTLTRAFLCILVCVLVGEAHQHYDKESLSIGMIAIFVCLVACASDIVVNSTIMPWNKIDPTN